MKDLTTEQLKDELTRRGYYTKNLWHIDDVNINWSATNEQAQVVLDRVMQSEWLISNVFEMINDECDSMVRSELDSNSNIKFK